MSDNKPKHVPYGKLATTKTSWELPWEEYRRIRKKIAKGIRDRVVALTFEVWMIPVQ